MPSSEQNVLASEKVRTLTQLRWAAGLGQAATVLITTQIMGLSFPLAPLFTIIAIEFGASAASAALLHWSFGFRPWHVLALLLFDVVALTGLLHFSGGPQNPFSFLFLVHIVLAALLLGTRDAWILTVVSAGLSASLFVGEPREHNHELMGVHLNGMWVAFVIAAALIVTFVGRILNRLERRQAELDSAQARTSRAETASKLGMLATGAAHELATPLSTIALISGDLSSFCRTNPDLEGFSEDAELLRSEVSRCRHIIEEMASEAGTSIGEELLDVPVARVVEDALSRIPKQEIVDVTYETGTDVMTMHLAPRGFARAISCLIENGIAASGPDSRVTLKVRTNDESLQFAIEDSGPGIPDDLLDRVKDPFFTTKSTGKGLGLGLFFAETVISELGGRLEIYNGGDDGGACALATIPRLLAPPNGRRSDRDTNPAR